jgi:hypothetical protein
VTGSLLASGREADVYALDDRRVLRRYRREADVTGEVAAMLDDVVRFRDGQLDGTERLDLTAVKVLACAP